MPLLKIETNLTKEKIPENFLQDATALLSAELGKPESIMSQAGDQPTVSNQHNNDYNYHQHGLLYVCIQVCPDQVMSFGGKNEPCANITLNCIGVVGPEKNRNLAPVLSNFIERKLGIQQDRFYINIFDIQRPYCVWNGKTFG